MTKIEWTGRTWNPVTGCTKISPGCDNCYAQRMAQRLAGRYGYPKEKPFAIAQHWDKMEEPDHWVKPQMIFVCSMGDLFHDDVPDYVIEMVIDAIQENQRHIFQVLTKRPDRAVRYFQTRTQIIGNLWFGVTAENQVCADRRIPMLKDIPAHVRFASFEPLLGAIRLNNLIQYLDWIIIGGETGPHARPMYFDWAANLIYCAQENYVPVFFKSWGEYDAQVNLVGKKQAGRMIFGREWNDYPLGI